MATQEIAHVDDRPRASEQVVAPRERTIVLPWQRLALGAVLIVAAVLDVWQLDRVAYGNTYYAAAVRSMLQNWHAFFFNSFDPPPRFVRPVGRRCAGYGDRAIVPGAAIAAGHVEHALCRRQDVTAFNIVLTRP